MRNLILVFAAAGAVAAADLPVREVVLYKNGIGYFRRAGELRAGESARLEFKASEMDDVLKSLTVIEEGGGRIGALRYDSSDLLSRKMAEFPFRILDRQPLSALLDQLKGARVELKLGAEAAAGPIVGARDVLPSNGQPGREELSLFTDAGLLRTIDLSGVSGIRFADANLQLQLKDYLAGLVQSRSKDKRAVYIDSTDAGTRRLAAAYVAPTPVWKSSYRLVFSQAGDATLEGWAIVDNTSGEDWTNVRLALVSGRPVSFVSRLYEPRYLARPFAELPEDRAASPEIHRGGVVGGIPGGLAPAAAPVPPPPRAQMAAKQEVVADYAAGSLSSIERAGSGELGELFEYRFATPVTVKKDESAMLPFLQDRIKVRKLLIYSLAGGENPRNAAELANSTGKTLDGGPITVYDGNAYAGEALMEMLKSADKRLISYAVDLGTRITTKIDSAQDLVREVHFRRGVLTTRTAFRETRTYTVRNVDQKPKVLIVEHPIRQGFALLSLKPSETTPDSYRFEVKLAAGATEKFPVAEENIRENSIALASVTPDLLFTYIQNKNVDAAARRSLEEIAKQKQAIADADGEIRRADEQLNDLARDEERTRQNIASLSRVTGQQDQVQNYARQLAAQEARIASLRDGAAELRKKKAALEAVLRTTIDNMEF